MILKLLVFFTGDDPLPEVSLLLSTGAIPMDIDNYALTHYAGSSDKDGSPLKDLKMVLTTPYILPVPKDIDNDDQ